MEAVVRVGVTVTFLRMDRPPADPARLFPPDAVPVRVAPCSVLFYRYLYGNVGAAHVWWLRRAASDAELEALLRQPEVAITALYVGGEPYGFYELDARGWPDVNISYFGLMPHAVGRGLGPVFLRHAIDTAWASGARGMTVNTCTADSPRALPTYLRAGFRPVRHVREVWNVPVRLGLKIPPGLQV
ncbi:MAG: GNAT family N-acetyltransferase [Acetobacteraceae bacterium]|nr:GNAT family N-acetyltransferase [Acetobacteraceae bacterium]